jgi:hypothetical protein
MPNAQRIKNLSRLMVSICSIVMVCVPASLIWYWANFGDYAPSLQAQRPEILLSMDYISGSQLLMAGLISLTASTLIVYALWQLRRLFLLFMQGVVFSSETTRALNLFGLALLGSVMLKPITTALLSVVLTWGNPLGQRSVTIALGSNELVLLLFAVTFLVITWVFREGQRLSQENAEFV